MLDTDRNRVIARVFVARRLLAHRANRGFSIVTHDRQPARHSNGTPLPVSEPLPPLERTGANDDSRVIPVARDDAQPAVTPCRLDPTMVALDVAAEAGLSRRESEVLVAAAQGLCTKEIAVGLGISGKTVDYFWKRIFKKLARTSHAEVMALLLRHACQKR